MALQESFLQTGATTFVERHGYQLPAVYSDFASEYEAATNGVGLHDASYIGRLKATGEDGLDLLNRMSTNKVVDLAAGQGGSHGSYHRPGPHHRRSRRRQTRVTTLSC